MVLVRSQVPDVDASLPDVDVSGPDVKVSGPPPLDASWRSAVAVSKQSKLQTLRNGRIVFACGTAHAIVMVCWSCLLTVLTS